MRAKIRRDRRSKEDCRSVNGTAEAFRELENFQTRREVASEGPESGTVAEGTVWSQPGRKTLESWTGPKQDEMSEPASVDSCFHFSALRRPGQQITR